MRLVSSMAAMQRLARQNQRAGVRVGLVPTMGGLHEGHLCLVRRARRAVGQRGRVVVSLYVNPTQFAPHEDLRRYPRDLARDRRLCRDAGVDVLFAPEDEAMYPSGPSGGFSTWVIEELLSRGMEGHSRPTHFRGVTTVVAKLFHLIQPDVAVFGAKDWQQAAVIRRMVRDLNFPIRLLVAPTHREPDGLAMSSRNRYLTGRLRAQATVLYRSIAQARRSVRKAASGVPVARLLRRLRVFIGRQPDARVDYIEFFHPETLEAVRVARRGDHMALAVFIGKARLIDNGRL